MVEDEIPPEFLRKSVGDQIDTRKIEALSPSSKDR